MRIQVWFFVALLVTSLAGLEPNPEIVNLLQRAEKTPDLATIVTIEQQILAILIASGLAWTAQSIRHRRVGFHK